MVAKDLDTFKNKIAINVKVILNRKEVRGLKTEYTPEKIERNGKHVREP